MMNFPHKLRDAILKEVGNIPLATLTQHVKLLTLRYREGGKENYMSHPLDYLAYLLYRMPATFAVISAVFEEICERYNKPIHSLIDMGSGPGSGFWASKKFFNLSQVTCIEKDRALLALSKRLADQEFLSINADFTEQIAIQPHDLALFSYSLGEVTEWQEIVKNTFKQVELIIVIEPGTPRGFKRISEVRDLALSMGAHLIAPCPHAAACPIKEGDWCHFSKRLERSKIHKELKGAELGFEDEKYSYIAFAKNPGNSFNSRILRHPIHHRGHSLFILCSKNGAQEEIILSRRDKELYKISKKKEWGNT